MSKNEMVTIIEQLRNYEELAANVKAKADALRDIIKAELDDLGVDEMVCGNYIIRNTPVLSTRFDTTKFKKLYPELYFEYTRQVSSKRFAISV